MTSKNLETLALQRTVMQQNEIEQGIVLARQKGLSLVNHIVDQKGFSEEALAEGFAAWLKVPRVRIASLALDPEAGKAISEKIALKYQCLPLKVEGKRLVMAMANPADYDAIQDVQFVSGFTVQPVVATRSEILDGIEELYRTDELMQEFLSQVNDSVDFTILAEEGGQIKSGPGRCQKRRGSGPRGKDVQFDSSGSDSFAGQRCAPRAGIELHAGADAHRRGAAGVHRSPQVA